MKQISPALVASFVFLFIALAISPAAIPQKLSSQAADFSTLSRSQTDDLVAYLRTL